MSVLISEREMCGFSSHDLSVNLSYKVYMFFMTC